MRFQHPVVGMLQLNREKLIELALLASTVAAKGD